MQRYGESSCDAIAFSNVNSKCIVYTRRANGLTDNAEPVEDANFEFCSFYTETIVTDWLRTTIGTVFGDVGVERVWSNNQCDDPSRESQGTCTGLWIDPLITENRVEAFNTPSVSDKYVKAFESGCSDDFKAKCTHYKSQTVGSVSECAEICDAHSSWCAMFLYVLVCWNSY